MNLIENKVNAIKPPRNVCQNIVGIKNSLNALGFNLGITAK